MIQHAFTSAYTNSVSQRNQGISNITAGVKDLATVALGAAGFAGGLGNGAVANAAKHALANRVGGIGGNIMLSTMQEKKAAADTSQNNKQLFNREEIQNTITSQLSGNPINNAAVKQLSTVFETLERAKDEHLINSQGKYSTSIGDIDPNSELGKRITGGLSK